MHLLFLRSSLVLTWTSVVALEWSLVIRKVLCCKDYKWNLQIKGNKELKHFPQKEICISWSWSIHQFAVLEQYWISNSISHNIHLQKMLNTKSAQIHSNTTRSHYNNKQLHLDIIAHYIIQTPLINIQI